MGVKCFAMTSSRATTSAKIPPQLKQAKAKLAKSNKAAKEFEAELQEIIEEAREDDSKPAK
jgi:F0F1-type ATP synthase membrane subunit b/b'